MSFHCFNLGCAQIKAYANHPSAVSNYDRSAPNDKFHILQTVPRFKCQPSVHKAEISPSFSSSTSNSRLHRSFMSPYFDRHSLWQPRTSVSPPVRSVGALPPCSIFKHYHHKFGRIAPSLCYAQAFLHICVVGKGVQSRPTLRFYNPRLGRGISTLSSLVGPLQHTDRYL